MGRDSGFVALHAALANSDSNLCLLPEVFSIAKKPMLFASSHQSFQGLTMIVIINYVC